MSGYLAVRRWVDGLWAEAGNNVKVTFLPVTIGALMIAVIGVRSGAVWVVYAALASTWIAFVFWRGWRVGKATAVRADRHYDRVGKFDLAPEYHRTESATATTVRKKKQKHG